MRHLLRLLVTAAVLVVGSTAPVDAQTQGGWWAQVLRPAELWSGPAGGAESFGQLPRGHYVYVAETQPHPAGGRVYVREAAEKAFGYVDAVALAPSGPPPEEGGSLPPVVSAPLFQASWVANHAPAHLFDDPNDGSAILLALQPYSKMLVLGPPVGQRYYVQDGRSTRTGYVDAALIGPSDPPVPGELDPPPSLTRNPAFDAATAPPGAAPKSQIIVNGWKGVITGDVVNLRAGPITTQPWVAQARLGDEVTVAAWAEGEELDKDNRTWARLTSITRKDYAGQPVELLSGHVAAQLYVYSGLLRPLGLSAPPAPPRTALGSGGARWIDVNLTHQTVAAYEGDKMVFFAPTTSGRPGWETPVGTHRVQRRVENETMIGSTLLRLDTLEIPDYRLENVKWTQYFTAGGAALHTNYWRPAALFGMPSSHGCLGLLEEHAKWLWDWARVGTPLLVHY